MKLNLIFLLDVVGVYMWRFVSRRGSGKLCPVRYLEALRCELRVVQGGLSKCYSFIAKKPRINHRNMGSS